MDKRKISICASVRNRVSVHFCFLRIPAEFSEQIDKDLTQQGGDSIKRRKLFTKNFWKEGSGEILGFLCTVPIIMFLMIMLIGIIQMGSLKERMEYATYMACRAAVVSKDYDSAVKIAQKIASEDLASFSDTVSDVKVDLRVISEKSAGSSNPKASSLNGKSKKQKEKLWIKGNMCRCTITLKAKTLTPLISGKKTCTLTMMIERDPGGLSELFSQYIN